MSKSQFTHLECHECGKQYDPITLQRFCTVDNQPLEAKYDFSNPPNKEELKNRSWDMWRYREMLPVFKDENIVSLGEGMSPLLDAKILAKQKGFGKLLIKDEGQNPTGSFKARGLSMAISKAKELGVAVASIPTAGNAGSALSAYGAKAGMTIHAYMPVKTPNVFQLDCAITGANVNTIDGNISDAGKQMHVDKQENWWDVTTLKEPYRLEGKKTMGYEIAEQLKWKLPDVILYPTGGGTGLIGIWKAFKEMKALGWIEHIPTRMVAVQIEQCNPIVQAFNNKAEASVPYTDPGVTIANGLRVPHAFGHKLIMKTLYESNGCAIDVSDNEMKNGISELAKNEGLFVSPEGAAVWEAAKKLKHSGWIKDTDSVILLNTGSAYKYIENILDLA